MRWAFLAAVLAFLLPATAAACSCVPRWMILQSELTNPRSIIFVGTVEGQAPGSPPSGAVSFFQQRLVRIRPSFFLRGSWPARPIEVWGEGPGGCGPALEVGQLYLVFSRRSEDGKLAAEGCSSTAPLYFHALFLGFLAVALMVVTAGAWSVWRLFRRLVPSRRYATEAPRTRTVQWRTRLPLVWLAVSAGFMALAWTFGNLGPRFAPPVEISICNRGSTQPLEEAEATLVPARTRSSAAQLGRVPPGECRTTQLATPGAEAVRFTYRLEGVQFTVSDQALGYVEGGFHAYTDVTGPGTSESGVDLPHEPDLRVMTLVVGLLSSMVVAFAAFLCAVGTGLWRLWPRRASPQEG